MQNELQCNEGNQESQLQPEIEINKYVSTHLHAYVLCCKYEFVYNCEIHEKHITRRSGACQRTLQGHVMEMSI